MMTRADMAHRLALRPGTVARTFVLEAHTSEPDACLAELADGGAVDQTEDAFLFRLRRPEGDIWVDQLDGRFWTLHTDLTMEHAAPFLEKAVNRRRDLDWMWLPSDHLRRAWPGARTEAVRTDFEGRQLLGGDAPVQQLRARFSGHDVERLLERFADTAGPVFSFSQVQAHLSDPEFGAIREGMSRNGRFVVAGDSLEFHLQFVRTVVQRYKRLVTLCEEKSIQWRMIGDTGEPGGMPRGGPIVIRFSRPIQDLSTFANQLFAAREPFRLWGVPELHDDFIVTEAVDLHVGQRLRIEVGLDWMRVYLEDGGCGNTVARLVSNLQHRYDGALSMTDPELQDAITAHHEPVSAGAG